MSIEPTPPDGYELVHSGKRQIGDMRWSNFDQRWSLVFSDSIGETIEDLPFPVARKAAQKTDRGTP